MQNLFLIQLRQFKVKPKLMRNIVLIQLQQFKMMPNPIMFFPVDVQLCNISVCFVLPGSFKIFYCSLMRNHIDSQSCSHIRFPPLHSYYHIIRFIRFSLLQGNKKGSDFCSYLLSVLELGDVELSFVTQWLPSLCFEAIFLYQQCTDVLIGAISHSSIKTL